MKFNLKDITDAAEAVTEPLLRLIRGEKSPHIPNVPAPRPPEDSAVYFVGFQTAKNVQKVLAVRNQMLDIGVSVSMNCPLFPLPPDEKIEIKVLLTPEMEENEENETAILFEKIRFGINFYVSRALEAHPEYPFKHIRQIQRGSIISFQSLSETPKIAEHQEDQTTANQSAIAQDQLFTRVNTLRNAFALYLTHLTHKNPENTFAVSYIDLWIQKIARSDWRNAENLQAFLSDANDELPSTDQ